MDKDKDKDNINFDDDDLEYDYIEYDDEDNFEDYDEDEPEGFHADDDEEDFGETRIHVPLKEESPDKGAKKEPDLRETRVRPEKRETKKAPSKPAKKEKGSQYLVFLIVTVFIGIIVVILIMAMVMKYINSTKPVEQNLKPTTEVTEEVTTETPVVESKEISLIGVVKSIANTSGKAIIYDFEEGSLYNLETDNESELKDKYGQKIVLPELQVGDVVTVTFSDLENKIITLKKNSEAWEKREAKVKEVDLQNKSITIDNNTYKYDAELITLYNESPYNINNLKASDIVNIKGYKQKILYLELSRGHGSIRVINKDKIVNGTLKIGNLVYTNLSEAEEKYELSEGSYEIVVKGDNIDPFIKTISLTEGSAEVVDLSEVKVKSGTLSIRSNVTDYKLTIDDKEYPINEPIVLGFGTYKIIAEKDQYKTIEKTVKVDTEMVSVDLEFEQVVTMAKIKITTEPPGANVYIDNMHVGTSPIEEVMIVYGEHRMYVQKEGYTEIVLPIDITEEGKKIFNVRLTAEAPPTVTPTQNPTQNTSEEPIPEFEVTMNYQEFED